MTTMTLRQTLLAGAVLAALLPVAPAQVSINKGIAPLTPVQQVEEKQGTGFLGVYLEDSYVDLSTDKVKSDLHWGAQVKGVVPESSAADAGLAEGDLILGVNGRSIRTSEDLTREIAALDAGQKVELRLLRDEKEQTITATLKERPQRQIPGIVAPNSGIAQRLVPPTAQFAPAFPDMDSMIENMRSQMDEMNKAFANFDQFNRAQQNAQSSTMQSLTMVSSDKRLGVVLQNLTPQLCEFFGAPAGTGALVATVEEKTPAAEAGLKAGDVIIAVDGNKVSSPMDAQNAIVNSAASPTELEIVREKKTVKLKVDLTTGASTSGAPTL